LWMQNDKYWVMFVIVSIALLQLKSIIIDLTQKLCFHFISIIFHLSSFIFVHLIQSGHSPQDIEHVIIMNYAGEKYLPVSKCCISIHTIWHHVVGMLIPMF
jgi:hypothetical protein